MGPKAPVTYQVKSKEVGVVVHADGWWLVKDTLVHEYSTTKRHEILLFYLHLRYV